MMHDWPGLYLLAIMAKWFKSLLLADLHVNWDGIVLLVHRCGCGPAWTYCLLIQSTGYHYIVPFQVPFE